jgi:DNA modification methylase
MNSLIHLLEGNALTRLHELDDESIDCCVTSPPYWALRDYKVAGQLGVEHTIDEYIRKLVEIFDQVKRVLKKTGSCWVVIGDTYAGTGHKAGADQDPKRNEPRQGQLIALNNKVVGIPEKSLCMIPERFAIAMIDHGLILRNKIIWYKPNCMPSSAKDRFTVDWEYVYFFTKSQRYYFETQYESALNPEDDVRRAIKTSQYNRKQSYFGGHYHNNKQTEEQVRAQMSLGRIKRCVWKISTKPFSGAHFAVFPPDLVEPMIKAGCHVEGIVLDPFMGAGTTGLVALQNARNFIGIELNPQYIEMAKKRLEPWIKQERLVITI